MIPRPLSPAPPPPSPGVRHTSLCIRTRRALEFVDLTADLEAWTRRVGLEVGLLAIQTRHTTTAIVVNEHEPLLLQDLADLLRRQAPREARYRHDDMRIRSVNLSPGERANGHAHARALLLGTSEALCVVGGQLQLGRWQRVFLVELDGPRERGVAVTAVGRFAGEAQAPTGLAG